MRLIFVYGTLKKGYGNNVLLRKHPFVSEGVVHGCKLYNCGFPVARKVEGCSSKGELWDIENDQSTLASLDRLEGEGRMYFRERVQVESPSGTVEAEMYIGNPGLWNFDDRKASYGLSECPINSEGHYVWGRP